MKGDFLDYKLKGYCCSQIIALEGLAMLGKENPDIVQGVGGLCFGMGKGETCGIVTAAMIIFHLADPQEADLRWCQDFIDWFEGNFDSINCSELLEGDPLNKVEKCPRLIQSSLVKIEELLEIED